MFCRQLVPSLCSCSNSSWSRRTGPSSKTVMVLITNITLQRGGIWNLSFKHHRSIFKHHKKLFFKNHIICFPSLQPCNWVGFKISLSLSRESAIYRDEIENYFSCSHLARRDRDYHMTILVFRDENGIRYCYSHVSRRDRDFRKSFLVVERGQMKLTLVENSRDREFSLTSDAKALHLFQRSFPNQIQFGLEKIHIKMRRIFQTNSSFVWKEKKWFCKT